MQGKVEDLIGTALSNYAIGAAEDCSRKLDMFVNSNVLDVIQRSASKPWVSETPYAKNACTPDLSVLLIDSTKLDGDFVDAFLWWSKVLNLNERFQILLLSFQIDFVFFYSFILAKLEHDLLYFASNFDILRNFKLSN